LWVQTGQAIFGAVTGKSKTNSRKAVQKPP